MTFALCLHLRSKSLISELSIVKGKLRVALFVDVNILSVSLLYDASVGNKLRVVLFIDLVFFFYP